MNKKLILHTFLHAIIAVEYIFGISFLLSNAEKIFDNKMPNLFGPVAFLLLFVISVALMGILVFGRPVLLYLDNKKKEAFLFLFCTIGWLAIALILTFCYLIIF